MAFTMMTMSANVSRPFTASVANRPARRSARTIVRASKDAQEAPSEFMLKAVGTLAAVQLAFLPAAEPALAAKGKLAVEGALDAGEAAQQAVPKGATNPKLREERNSSRDQGIDAKLSIIKQRINPDNILNSPDIESGGRQNIFAPSSWGQSSQKGVSFETASAPSLQVNVGFNGAADKGLLRAVGNPVRESDLGNRQPKADPFAPAEDKLPVKADDVTDAVSDAAGKAADAAKDAAPGGVGGILSSLGNKIKEAAITDNSPSVQLEQGANKAKGAVQDLKQQSNVAFTPAAQGSLLHFVSSDMDNASFQGPESNEGGITQPTIRTDQKDVLKGDPKRGGDLKDSTTDFAAQNKGGRDEGTPGLTGATPRAGANTPKGTTELRNPSTPVLPNFLGGKNLVRDDSESPEEVASGNIAKAQQSSGNAVDSIKKGLGL